MPKYSNYWQLENEDPLEFGERLLAALKMAGMNQAALAVAIGTDPSTVSCWMSGVSKPAYYSIKAMAIALHVRADYLLGLDGIARYEPGKTYVETEAVK